MNIMEALNYFGIDVYQDIDMRVQGRQEMVAVVRDEIISKCKQEYKRKAKALHPDVGGDAESMRELNEAMDKVKQLNIEIRPRAPAPQFVQVVRFYYGGSAASTTSTNYTGYGWGF